MECESPAIDGTSRTEPSQADPIRMPLGMGNDIHIAEETPGAINKMPDHFLRGLLLLHSPARGEGWITRWLVFTRATNWSGKGEFLVKIDLIVLGSSVSTALARHYHDHDGVVVRFDLSPVPEGLQIWAVDPVGDQILR